MKNSITSKLKGYFKKGFRKKLKEQESLTGLIDLLEEKKIQLVHKLEHEDDKRKLELIKNQLKVLEAQLKKARLMLN
jgi:hypothetical protein